MSYNRFNEYKILDSIIEKHSIWTDMKNIESQLVDLKSNLKIYRNNKSLSDSLSKSIEDKTIEIENRNKEVIRLSKENKVLEETISSMNIRLDYLKQYSENRKDIEDCESRKKNLKDEFESVKDNIQTVKNKVDSLNILKDELTRYENIINPLSEEINQIKFNLSNIVGYQQEFKEVADRYEKIVFIRNACSPGNGKGIQSEYIKRYMNDIIIDCNSMLAYMFNGSIQLDIPIINEKQFSIPFMGPGGLMVPDISNGSTAQRCMIGLVFSCVAMMKSSIKYNIPRFDEIDGGLDQSNRVTFITVLNQILDFMRSEQCIICSHNTEFESYNTTRIYASVGGITIEQ
jgi:DNA repair exonuclease SbcCD ATPase subunit